MLQSQTCSPYEPSKLLSDRHRTMKMFSLGPGLSHEDQRVTWLVVQSRAPKGWTCSTFFLPNFVTRSQNPAPPMCFDEFTIHSSEDFVSGNGEMLVCPVKVIRRYMPKTELVPYLLLVVPVLVWEPPKSVPPAQYRPACSNTFIFIFIGRKKKFVTKIAVSFCLQLVINEVCRVVQLHGRKSKGTRSEENWYIIAF